RSKRGICLDLKEEKGRRVFHKLVEEADVFVSNMRRPALKRLGADYETLSQINQSIVYGRASGYGPNGPDADLGGMDVLGQARGGIMSMTGEPDRGPKPAGVAVADHVGAMSMAFGLMVALFHRERTGEGQEVDASLLGGQICIQTFNLTDYLWSNRVRGRIPRAGINPTWSIYKGSDGKWFVIGMNRQRYWARICEVLGKPNWNGDERYATLEARLENRDALFAEFDALFATKAAAYWVKLFSDADLLAAPVNDYADVAKDPQCRVLLWHRRLSRAADRGCIPAGGPQVHRDASRTVRVLRSRRDRLPDRPTRRRPDRFRARYDERDFRTRQRPGQLLANDSFEWRQRQRPDGNGRLPGSTSAGGCPPVRQVRYASGNTRSSALLRRAGRPKRSLRPARRRLPGPH